MVFSCCSKIGMVFSRLLSLLMMTSKQKKERSKGHKNNQSQLREGGHGNTFHRNAKSQINIASMAETRNQNHNDASINTCDINDGVAPWLDLNHDLLLVAMVKLGVIDFIAFSGVCKSWRLEALSNRNKFMMSKPPRSISVIPNDANNENLKCCYLEDFDGRKFKTILPHSVGRTCTGVTHGYLILYGEKTRDFWLVNIITWHELRFPFPFADISFVKFRRGILVFSPSISKWVFVLFNRYTNDVMWYCTVDGKSGWTYIHIRERIIDLIAIKGRIYVLYNLYNNNRLAEVTLFPTPKVTLLETIKNVPNPRSFKLPRLVTSGDQNNLYVMDLSSEYPYNIQEINLCKLEWVPLPPEKLGEEYKFFFTQEGEGEGGVVTHGVELWADLYSRYKGRKESFFHANMWYFFDHRLNLNLLQAA